MTFSEKLKELRNSKHYTQKTLAERLGVAKSIVSYYENGDRLPSIDVLIKIAALFHVSTDYLLDRETKLELDTSSLTKEQIGILQSTIDEFIKANDNKNK